MAVSWTTRTISPEAIGSRNVGIYLVMSLTLISPAYLARPPSATSSILTYFLNSSTLWPTDSSSHWQPNRAERINSWCQNNGDNTVFRTSPETLFLGQFVAGGPGRKQEVSVVVVGMGGEQKKSSRLEGKWVWWVLPPISQIPTDHKQFICYQWSLWVYLRGRRSSLANCQESWDWPQSSSN